MELVASIIIGVLLIEAYAWLPKISEWLLERAVVRLEDGQELCREAWKADLDALPNTMVKLAWVLHLNFRMAADRINAEEFQAKCDELDYFIKDLSDEHSKNVQQLHALKLRIAEHEKSARSKIDHSLEDLMASVKTLETRADLVNPLTQRPLQESLRRCARAVERFSGTLNRALTRSRELMRARADRASNKIDHADTLLKNNLQKRLDIIERRSKHELSLKDATSALEELTDDLERLRIAIQNDDDDDVDRQLKSEQDKIGAAILCIVQDSTAQQQ